MNSFGSNNTEVRWGGISGVAVEAGRGAKGRLQL